MKAEVFGMPYDQISRDLGNGIAVSTISSIVKQYRTHGTIEPHQGKHVKPHAGLMTERHADFIFDELVRAPYLTLDELRFKLRDATGTLVSASTICRSIWKRGLTRKKVRRAAHRLRRGASTASSRRTPPRTAPPMPGPCRRCGGARKSSTRPPPAAGGSRS